VKPAQLIAWAAGAGIVILAAQPGSTLSARAGEPFDGRWASDLEACAGASAPASPVVVNSLSLQWREAACVVRTSYRVRDAWHIGARCWGEGAISNVPITLRMRGEQLLLGWAGAPAEELRRCP
jgi:hypothetical protein